MAGMEDEKCPLVEQNNTLFNNATTVTDNASTHDIKVYRRRWWILTLFSFLCTLQGMVWNTWGPIAAAAEAALGWSDGIIALFNNLNIIVFCVVVIPGSMYIDAKGMRFSMIASCGVFVFSTVVRCFSMKPEVMLYTSYACAILTGFGTVLPWGGPARMAALWFPQQERPVATSIGTFFNNFGLSVSFIIGPQFVPDPVYELTDCNQTSDGDVFKNILQCQKNVTASLLNLKEIETGMQGILFTHLAISVLLFVCVLVYFPAKPPKPPSFTASLNRTDYRKALRDMFDNRPFIIILLAGALPIGACAIWIAIIDVVLKPLGVSQLDAGWMGFCNITLGCFAGIIFARYSGIFHRKRKYFLIIMYTCASLMCLWFTLLANRLITVDLASMYVSIILLGMFITGSAPLFYELCAEMAYPVSEGVTGGVYTFLMAIFQIIISSSISLSGTINWVNWTVLGSVFATVPLLVLFPETHRRTDLDMYIDL